MTKVSEILTGRVIPYSEHKVHLAMSALRPALEGDSEPYDGSPPLTHPKHHIQAALSRSLGGDRGYQILTGEIVSGRDEH